MRLASRSWILLAVVGLTACAESAHVSFHAGVGPDPLLPPPHPTLIPTVNIAPAKGWPPGATPIAADGLKVAAFASGLDHPRWLYVLPNGDVLVAETNRRLRRRCRKRRLQKWIMKQVMARAGATGRAPIASRLLRDADGDGVAETRIVFLRGFTRPSAWRLSAMTFFVANADAIVRFPYSDGCRPSRSTTGSRWSICRPGDQSSLDQEPPRQPRRHATLRHRRVEQQRRGERHGPVEEGRAAIWEIDLQTPDERGCSRRGCAIRTAWPGNRRAARCGPWSTSATNSAAISCPTT